MGRNDSWVCVEGRARGRLSVGFNMGAAIFGGLAHGRLSGLVSAGGGGVCAGGLHHRNGSLPSDSISYVNFMLPELSTSLSFGDIRM